MALMNTDRRYGIVAKFFHWTVAALVIAMLAAGLCLRFVKGTPYASTIFTIHKSTGLTVLIIMTLRLMWRWINPLPQLPITTPEWQRLAARSVHRLFYLAIFTMVLAGWGMSTAAGYPVNFWWLVKVNMPFVPKSQSWQITLATVHTYTAYVIMGLIVVHVLAACKHHFVDKDFVVQRMWREPNERL